MNMRTVVFIASYVILSSVIILSASVLCDISDTSADDWNPVIVEEYPDRTLYMIETSDGPFYFYQIPTEHGNVYKVVAMATVTLSITVSY